MSMWNKVFFLAFEFCRHFSPPSMDYLYISCIIWVFSSKILQKVQTDAGLLLNTSRKLQLFWFLSLNISFLWYILVTYLIYSELTFLPSCKCHLKFAWLTCSFKNHVLDFRYFLSSLQLWAAS